VLKLGMLLTVAGFAIGWCAELILQYSEPIAIQVLNAGKMIMVMGFILLAYYFMVFVNVTKKSETVCEKELVEEITTELNTEPPKTELNNEKPKTDSPKQE